jgi:hypothetical protein
LLNAILLALFLAAPSVSRPPRMYAANKPRVSAAGVPQTLYTGPATVGGQTGTLTLTFTPDAVPVPVPVPTPTPTPTPIPSDPVITSYLGPGRTPLPANITVPVGTMLFINGFNFGSQYGTVMGQGKSLRIMTWGGSEIGVILPDQPTGGARLVLTVTRPDGRSVSGASVALSGGAPVPTPSPNPTPTPGPILQPQIRSYRDEQGSATQYFLEGSRVRVIGEGFGTTPGMLWVDGTPFPAASWSDTEVDFIAPKATIPGSTVTTSLWQSVGIRRADQKSYTDQWGVKFQQPRRLPTVTQDADPIPLPWATQPPAWVETQPFAVGGRYFDIQVHVLPAPGVAPDPPPSPLPPVVTAPIIAGGHYFTLEITPVPVAGGPPVAKARNRG